MAFFLIISVKKSIINVGFTLHIKRRLKQTAVGKYFPPGAYKTLWGAGSGWRWRQTDGTKCPPEPCTHKLSSFHELMDCKCCFQDVKCCVTMQSDPILIWILSWDCRVRRAETSLCPVFILINGKKKDSGLQEREIEDQTRAWMDLTCLFIFVVLFVCFYK